MSRLIALLFALTLAVPGVALAQDPHPMEDRPDEGERDRIEQRIQMMRVYALTDALELDEETATKLFPYLREGDEKMRALHREQKDAKKRLRDLVQSDDVDDATLDEIVGVLASTEIELTKARKAQFMGLKRILSPDQRAKFFVAQERFDREVRRRMREIRRERRGDRRDRRDRGERRRGELD